MKLLGHFNALFALVVGACSLVSQPTQAMLSNRELSRCCRADCVKLNALCKAVLENTAQSLLFYRNLMDRQQVYPDVCFPEKLSPDELVKTYLKWLDGQNDRLDEAAFLGATAALSTAYGCPDQASSEPTPQP